MKPYEIEPEYQDEFSYQKSIDEVVDGCSEDTMLIKKDMLEKKAINVAAYYQNVEGDIDHLDKVIANLSRRRDKLKAGNKNLRGYLLNNMINCGISSIACPEFEIKVKKNPPAIKYLVPEGELMNTLPREYIKTEVVSKIDKTRIKNDLKSGKQIPDVCLESGHRVDIS